MFRNRKRLTVTIFKYVAGCAVICLIFKFFIPAGEEIQSIPKLDDLRKLMIEAERDNSERLLTVKRTCQKYNLGIHRQADKFPVYKHPPAPQYSVFYIARSRNLSYCPIYKAGSTTWIYNLCLLMNVPREVLDSGKEQISSIARRVMPELEFPEADEALKATKKVLVVRQPFERLLSAYRDKLENSVAGREHGTLEFYRKYGAKIVEKYRGRKFARPREDQLILRKDVPPPAGIEPTFREFVEYLIHTDLPSYGDDHWMPYYAFCAPCIVEYDIIARVETLWRDQLYTIHKLGLQEVIKPRWRHSGGHSNASRIYFSQLSKDTVRKLYEKFKLDFELFDYSPDVYYDYATGD